MVNRNQQNPPPVPVGYMADDESLQGIEDEWSGRK